MKQRLRNFEVVTNDRAGSAEGGAKRLARSARLQLILPERSVERLEALKEVTEATSFAEVIRRALILYEGILAGTREGDQLLLKKEDGTEVPIPLYSTL